MVQDQWLQQKMKLFSGGNEPLEGEGGLLGGLLASEGDFPPSLK